MKILHLCSTTYIDGWGYQDNLLPEYQRKLGYDVHVIAPGNHFPLFVKQKDIDTIKSKGNNYNIKGVEIHRIPTYLSTSNQSFVYYKLYRTICNIKPDIIFNHNVCTPMLVKAALYTKLHNGVKLVLDNHADYINCSKNKLWFNFYIRGFERMMAKICSPVITIAYGVTNMRCNYLQEVYGFKKNKVKLLPIGADTDMVNSISGSKEQLKNKYGLSVSDLVIISGGKMGRYKGTDNLLLAYKELKKTYNNLKLVLFGNFEDSVTEVQAQSIDGVSLQGWCDRQKTLELLKMADIACWPIHHTTLIEDAIACATPLILRKTGNTDHLVINNGEFVENGTKEDLFVAFTSILNNYQSYKEGALTIMEKYSYSNIAKEVINDCNKKNYEL